MVHPVTTLQPMQTAPSIAPRQRLARPPIVALVCSAGGLQALTSVLRPLPEAFPAAVIALQHHSPDKPSYVAELLAPKCRLRFSPAHQGTALRAGTVVVVPAGKHALVTQGDRLALIRADHSPYRPSADLLLTSLALVAARRTIAVILSGRGSDGATGAVAVHGFGGTVIAADKASSAYSGMPEAAISRGDAVDHVLPVGEIAALLISLTRCTPSSDRFQDALNA